MNIYNVTLDLYYKYVVVMTLQWKYPFVYSTVLQSFVGLDRKKQNDIYIYIYIYIVLMCYVGKTTI